MQVKNLSELEAFSFVFVNNAGILSKISLLNGQPKDIQKVIDVNLTSHFWVKVQLK